MLCGSALLASAITSIPLSSAFNARAFLLRLLPFGDPLAAQSPFTSVNEKSVLRGKTSAHGACACWRVGLPGDSMSVKKTPNGPTERNRWNAGRLLVGSPVLNVYVSWYNHQKSLVLKEVFCSFGGIFFVFDVCQRILAFAAWLGDEGRRELPATQTSEAGCTTLTCLSPTMPCCAVKIRCTTVLSRPRTDLQRAEQAQDNRPLNLARDVEWAKDRVLACRLREKTAREI